MSQQQRAASVSAWRPPWISFSLSGAAAYGSYFCYELGQGGNILGVPGALAAGVFATAQLTKALEDRHKLVIHERRRKHLKALGKKHHRSQWATKEDLKREGLIDGKGHGVFLGKFGKYFVIDRSENSGNIWGPPGSGKSTSVFASTLLSATAKSKRDKKIAPCFVINDPSYELFGLTAEYLRNAGYEVVVLSSWTSEISAVLNQKVIDARLDVFSCIDPIKRPESLRDDVKRAVKFLIPNEKPGTDEQTKFFNMGGRSLIEWAALYLVKKGYWPSLINVIAVVLCDWSTLRGRFVEIMEECEAEEGKDTTFSVRGLDEYLHSLTSGLLGLCDHAGEQFSGYLGVMQAALEPYSGENVAKHIDVTEAPGFDPQKLKCGEKPVAVFLMYPSERIATHHAMLNAEITYLLESVCSGRRGREVIALIDEAAGIQYIPSMLRFLAEGRKYRLRTFLGWQDKAQAEQTFSKTGLEQILASGQVLWCSQVREPGFAAMLSKLMGEQAIEDMSLNERTQQASAIADLTWGVSQKGAPLMKDIRTELGPDEALLIYKNMSPCVLKKVPYFENPTLLKRAGKPLFGG